jgi:hypothetical protein
VTAVVHLVWGPLGPSCLREFIDSYRRHPAGLEHELVVLFNGVDSEQRPALLAELDAVDHTLLTLEQPVQDLLAYRQAAERLEHGRICFMNSYSVLLAPGWLTKLSHALDQPSVGLAGATGSWASLRSWTANTLFLPNPYRGVAPERRQAFVQFRELGQELGGPLQPSAADAPRSSPAARALGVARLVRSTSEQLLRFEGFPTVHLRTNAFIVERSLLADLRIGRLSSKMDAYSLESGRNSLTAQVLRRGLRPQLVDRVGLLHEADHWAQSRTFWQGDQEQLLVADNQTRIYARGGLERRRLLASLAWGDQADPQAPIAGSGNLVPEPGPGG